MSKKIVVTILVAAMIFAAGSIASIGTANATQRDMSVCQTLPVTIKGADITVPVVHLNVHVPRMSRVTVCLFSTATAVLLPRIEQSGKHIDIDASQVEIGARSQILITWVEDGEPQAIIVDLPDVEVDPVDQK